MTYRVFQVQEVCEFYHYTYDVQADSEDEAIDKALNVEAEPILRFRGEPDYRGSGWSVRPAECTQADVDAAWEEAAQ
jgi:hypothetical protein